ncbi:uncharacterized protein STEHIDRAFT_167044 [Stereum hirsutum FP-91666 SS1]|uniref:uncharacterized protein n=1 Tax=Stereum hirsutum (strain FP-91666) TaxID=721885 RepID=UPI000440A4CA|nr:uncharacterized protein STEHIDRAFT_167044 [Stereum hirsutum FP-91666 SS1]EIM89152.1 hypothetical protein STEHIDRAFT_167044 [Stereum hirsutum FP-91666 SS1]
MSHESDSGGLTTPSTSLGDLPLSRSPARPGGGHRKNIPEKLESRLQVRSERFWFEEGNVIFELPGTSVKIQKEATTQYRVHSYFFVRDSSSLAKRIGKRKNVETPVLLGQNGNIQVYASDFEAFLPVLYPLNFDTGDDDTRLALNNLRVKASPVDKILLTRGLPMGRENNEWLVEGLVTLCGQLKFPTNDECQSLGMNDVHLIAVIRESIRTCECTQAQTEDKTREADRRANIIELLREQVPSIFTSTSHTQPSMLPPTGTLTPISPTETKSKVLPQAQPPPSDTSHLLLEHPPLAPPAWGISKPDPFSSIGGVQRPSPDGRTQNHPSASNVEFKDPDDSTSLLTSTPPHYEDPANIRSEGVQPSIRFEDTIGMGQVEQPDIEPVSFYVPLFMADDPPTTSPLFLSQELKAQAEADGQFNRGLQYSGSDWLLPTLTVKDEHRQSTRRGRNKSAGQWTESNLEAFARRSIANNAPSTRESGFNPIIGTGRGKGRRRGRGGRFIPPTMPHGSMSEAGDLSSMSNNLGWRPCETSASSGWD